MCCPKSPCRKHFCTRLWTHMSDLRERLSCSDRTPQPPPHSSPNQHFQLNKSRGHLRLRRTNIIVAARLQHRDDTTHVSVFRQQRDMVIVQMPWPGAQVQQCTARKGSARGQIPVQPIRDRRDGRCRIDAAQQTDFVHPLRYDLNHQSASCSRPYVVCNWQSSIMWSALSNAADRLSSVSTNTSPPSATRRMSESTFSTAVYIEWCALYADWRFGSSLWLLM